ncbi:MAG TPA: TonB-dependent receptor [Motiliproteus sp.]
MLAVLPPVTTATRLSQARADAPAAITLIDRAMIEASGAQEITDLFRLVPGLQAYHVNGNKFGVTVHGMGSPLPGRLEVMLDGRPIYLTGFSSPDWRALGIGINDIERIEVARTPSVATWGANAFQGAVNIITRNPVEADDHRLHLAGGSQNARRLAVSHSQLLGETALRVTGGIQANDGFSSNELEGDEGRSRYLSLRAIHTPSLVDQLDFQFGLSAGHGGIGDGSPPPPLSRRNFDSNYQSLTWYRSLESAGDLQLRFNHSFLEYRMERGLLSERFGMSPALLAHLGVPDEPIPLNLEEGATHRYDLELQVQKTFSSSLRGLWGIGLRQDEGKAPLLLNTQRTLRERFWTLFGNLEWQPSPGWRWNLGGMVEYSGFAGTLLSPRLALNYRLAEGQTLRASMSVAHRTPSLLEAYQDTRLTHSNGTLLLWVKDSDPQLRSERNRIIELGYLLEQPALHTEFDLRVFHEQIEHGIGRSRNGFTEFQLLPVQVRTTNSNNAAWNSSGLEVELRYRPDATRWVAVLYSYLNINGRMQGGDLDPGVSFSLDEFGPTHGLALLASQGFKNRLTLSGALYYQSATRWINGAETEAYTRIDTRLSKDFNFGARSATLAVVVQNVGGDYAEFQQRNRFETRTFLNLDLKL